MISKVTVQYFKQFESQEFDLSEHVVLAGPNNSGKTSLLQAIAVWRLALQKWTSEHPSGSKAKKRAAMAITRKEFTAIPLRDMKMLWTNTAVSLKKEEAADGKGGLPRVMTITLEGPTPQGRWELPFEFRYPGPEFIYVKPVERYLESLPEEARNLSIIHVPPFSGIGAEETRYDRPYQDVLIGQGKAGDILRNLLLEIWQMEDKSAWEKLCENIESIFGYRLSPPAYEGTPYILCEYLRGIPKGQGKNGLPVLDIASAGSGFHQVLLLLSFFYARPASVLLLDEPDAHLHVILQKQIHDRLRQIASERGSQLIIATHSEVLIDSTNPTNILSFFGKPHPLVESTEKDQVREALKRISSLEILRAEQSGGILYVESETDFNLLRAWAKVLGHPLSEWLSESPFWRPNQGCNPREARAHFFALRGISPEIKGFLLLDGDNRELPSREVESQGLVVERWTRYESESYLVHPDTLLRFVGPKVGTDLLAELAKAYLADELPGAVLRDPLGDHDYLNRTPASKTLLPGFFKSAGVSITKEEYYLVAEQMLPEEIALEVRDKLDTIQAALL